MVPFFSFLIFLREIANSGDALYLRELPGQDDEIKKNTIRYLANNGGNPFVGATGNGQRATSNRQRAAGQAPCPEAGQGTPALARGKPADTGPGRQSTPSSHRRHARMQHHRPMPPE